MTMMVDDNSVRPMMMSERTRVSMRKTGSGAGLLDTASDVAGTVRVAPQ